MTLAAWLHDFSPILFRISGEFAVRWYGLSYVAAFVIGWLILRALGRRGLVLIPPERALDAMVIIVLGTIVGGRLGYALFGYDFKLLYTFSPSFPYWNLLALQHGGMASHGGLLGLCIAAWWVSRGFKPETPGTDPSLRIGRCSTLHVMDTLALMAPPGLLLGRLANFINGELLGAIVSPPGRPGPWWTVMFPQELRGWLQPGIVDPRSHTPPLDGEQRVVLWNLVLDAWARAGQPIPKTKELLAGTPEQIADTWRTGVDLVIAHAGRYEPELSKILSSRHPSQLYQALAEGVALGAAVWLVAAKPRKPGVTAAWFFIVYGILRIVTEFWRLPDPQFSEGRPMGLSRGQWLSASMIVVGLGLLIFAATRSREKLGGWWSRRKSGPSVTSAA